MESLRDFVCGAKKGVPLVLPFLLNNEQQFFESYGPVSGSLRKIGPSEEWFLLCGHKDADRPAAPPGESLTDRHINAVNVGALFFIYFDRHVVLAPGVPVYRVFRMLEKVWACLIFQMIAQILTSVFQIPHCGATAADAHYFVFRSLS